MSAVELIPVSSDIEGAKAGSGSNSKPTREDDTTATLAKLSILYGLSEGVVRGFGMAGWTQNDLKKRVFLDGTPIMAEDGTELHNVEIAFRDGSIDQTAIEGMPSVTVETAVGIEARYGNPVARTFLRKEVNSYVVRISIPRLMRNTLEGDSFRATVEFAIDVASGSGSFSEYGRYIITEKISQGFQRDYSISLPQDNTRTIRVRKLTADGDNSMTFNSIIVEAITEVVEVKLRYPHTSLLWLKYNARDFNNAPKLEVLLDGKADLKIPKNYNPDTRAYAKSGAGTTGGVWNGEFKNGYTDNPVWHWLDLATNKRYGLGNRITIDIPDKFYLYSMARYCDELVPDGKGGLEPRFTCNNMYLQKQEDAFTVFKDLSSVFRAKTIWDGTHLTPKMDAPRDAMLVFSRANANNITYSSLSDSAQHNVIAVQYYDTENHYDSAFAYARSVENIQRRGKIEQVEVTALGCTSEGQAQRVADYLLNSELTETEIVTFTTGLDGIRPVVGDVFVFADDLMAGKATSGRVVSVAGKQVTLDRELNPTYDLNGTFIANTTETLASTRKIVAISEDKRTVTLNTAIDVVDITGLVWAVKSDSVGLREFTIDDIGYNAEDHVFTVTGLLYNRNKYSASDGAANIVNPPLTVIQPYFPTAPLLVTATYNVVVQQGINISNIEVAWTQVSKAVKYEVEMRRDGAEWRKLGVVQSLTMTLDNVYAGLYEFRVRSFDVRGAVSVYTQSGALLVAGKTLPPPALDQFTATGELMAIRADWIYPAAVQDSLAVIIEINGVNPTESVANVQSMYVPYPATSYKFTGLGAHTKLWLRAAIIDRYNIAGAFTAWVTATVDADPSVLLDLISGQISESALDLALNGKINDAIAKADAAGEAAASAAQDVVQTIIPQLDALQDGITNVTTAYQDADANLLSNIDAYKVSNDNAVASVLQKAESAVGTSTASAQEILAIKLSLDGVGEALGQKADTVIVDGITSTLEQQGVTLVAHTDALLSIDAAMDGLVDDIATKVDASVLDNYYTKLAADSAMAGRVTTYAATVDQALGQKVNSATLTTNYYTSAATNQAIATATMTIRSDIADNGLFKNLIDFDALLYGFYRADGSISGTTAFADAYDPNYYACTVGQRFAFTLRATGAGSFGSAGRMLWYTAAKVFISAADTHSKTKIGATVTVTAPAGAAFYRYSVIANDADMTMVTGNAAVEIRETTSAVNGTSAAKVVTVDNDGVLSGYGLMSEIANGQVTSTFGVNASTFYIGAPANNKKPFVVLTEAGKVNGVNVPAGTYIDTAYIGTATIKLAHINKASINELSALSANLGTFTTIGADGAKQVISGGRTEVFYPSGNIAIKFGVY